MTFGYDGAVAVVSGASSGLGRQLGVDLAARGATVIGIARRQPLLDELRHDLRRAGSTVAHEVLACDVSDPDAWPAALTDVEHRHGRIDVLVNAAGIEHRLGARSVRWEDVDRTFAVNFDAAVRATLAVVPGMLARAHGAVVNVSSDHGRAPGPGTPAYCASKAALSAFTESLAHELHGTGVHVHVLYPGWVPTPLGRGAVDAGMPLPPRAVRRTAQEVSRRTLDAVGGRNFEINATRVAVLAPAVRALLPPVYRRSMRRVAGS